jgi:Tfp pilus assembly protein PilF
MSESNPTRRPAAGLALPALLIALALLASSCGPAANPDAITAGTREEQMAAFTELGKARLLQEDLAGALSELSKAEAINPRNIDTLTLLGFTYYKRQEFDKAIEYFNRALEVDPSRSEVRNNLGLVYLEMKAYAQARREFEASFSNPTYARSYLAQYNLGLVEEAEGDSAKAEAIYRRVMAISPQYSPPYYRMGRIMSARGQHRDAADYLLNAVRLNPDYVEAYWALAETYERLGLIDEAAESYGKVINLAPNTPLAMEAQARVRKVLGFE